MERKYRDPDSLPQDPHLLGSEGGNHGREGGAKRRPVDSGKAMAQPGARDVHEFTRARRRLPLRAFGEEEGPVLLPRREDWKDRLGNDRQGRTERGGGKRGQKPALPDRRRELDRRKQERRRLRAGGSLHRG